MTCSCSVVKRESLSRNLEIQSDTARVVRADVDEIKLFWLFPCVREREAASKEEASKVADSKEEASKEAASQAGASQEAALKEAASKE